MRGGDGVRDFDDGGITRLVLKRKHAGGRYIILPWSSAFILRQSFT